MATPKLAFIPGPNDVVVKIGLGPGGISVKPDTFEVSLEKKEQVVWVCTQTHNTHGDQGQSPCFFVDFDPSDKPFGSAHFQGHPSPSGHPTAPANENKYYKYTVKIGNQALDPRGVVKP